MKNNAHYAKMWIAKAVTFPGWLYGVYFEDDQGRMLHVSTPSSVTQWADAISGLKTCILASLAFLTQDELTALDVWFNGNKVTDYQTRIFVEQCTDGSSRISPWMSVGEQPLSAYPVFHAQNGASPSKYLPLGAGQDLLDMVPF